jgi:hypothetical protein
MTNQPPPQTSPMGRLDAMDVGSRKLTVQTEFVTRPAWTIETRVFLGGTLKKTFTEEVDPSEESNLQAIIDLFHEARYAEIIEGLRGLNR